eukprot:scaffold556_cov221-Pinguiococcus_pyrenoidosus.AAC.17
MLRAANARLLQENDALRRLCMDPARNVQLENNAKVAAEEIQRQRLEISQLQRLLQDQSRESEGGVAEPAPAPAPAPASPPAAAAEAASPVAVAAAAAAGAIPAAVQASQLQAVEATLRTHSEAIENLVSRVVSLEAYRDAGDGPEAEADASVAAAAQEPEVEADAEAAPQSPKKNRRGGAGAAGRSKQGRSGGNRGNRGQANGSGKSADPVDSLTLPRQRTL